jgi:hypothetical protein
MGGYGSGRSGGRPTVEDSLSLNLPRLFKTGWLKKGAWTSGILRWSIVGTGEETASIGFEAPRRERWLYPPPLDIHEPMERLEALVRKSH